MLADERLSELAPLVQITNDVSEKPDGVLTPFFCRLLQRGSSLGIADVALVLQVPITGHHQKFIQPPNWALIPGP